MDRRRVLAIVAHPDDEAWCSGTLAAQVDGGLEVHLAVVCNGDMGGMPDRTPEERARVRQDEMAKAAGILSCELHWLGISDAEFMQCFTAGYDQLEWRFRNLMRQVDPQLLILPAPDDYHHHHRAVCEVALNASTNAANANLRSDLRPASGVPITLHMQPFPPGPFSPHVYVDISGAYERKMQALRCHESQHPFVAKQFGADLLSLVSVTAQTHGAACGVAYAEAFTLCRRFARVASIQRLAGFFPAPEGSP